MFTKTTRRSWLAMAGVTAGVVSVAAAPSGAGAQATTPSPAEPVPIDQWEPALGSDPAPASHGTCLGSTQATNRQTGQKVFFPTTAPGSGQTHCILVFGNQSPGVTKLQDAMFRCAPRQNIARDGIYGSQTRQAVRNVQAFWGIPVDGRYGPQTRSAMRWPVFNRDNTFDRCLRFSF